MAHQSTGCILLCVLVALVTTQARPLKDGETKTEFRMPDVQPQVKDTYLCYPREMGKSPTYLTGFVPHANMSTAHHILLYGCTVPGDDKKVWNCGEMQAEVPNYEMGPVCKEGAQIIYAWAMDAPELHLPEDVAFKVGGDTDIQWLVLQVHYKDVHTFLPPENAKDNSGLTLISTNKPQPKLAGVYLLGTNGELAPHSTTYMETACSYDETFPIHPFAFRVHAHTHGEVVSGYRVRDGQWEEIGRVSPKKPQMFYNVSHPGMDVEPGDILAARCTMKNDEDRTIKIGSTQNDEMCNFYIMYYVDGSKVMSENYCFSAGPPQWHWFNMEQIQSSNAPSDASIIPGEKNIIESTEKLIDETQNSIMEGEEKIKEDFLKLLDMFGDEYLENKLPMYNKMDDLEMPQRYDEEEEYRDYLRQFEPREGYEWEQEEESFNSPYMADNMVEQ